MAQRGGRPSPDSHAWSLNPSDLVHWQVPTTGLGRRHVCGGEGRWLLASEMWLERRCCFRVRFHGDWNDPPEGERPA